MFDTACNLWLAHGQVFVCWKTEKLMNMEKIFVLISLGLLVKQVSMIMFRKFVLKHYRRAADAALELSYLFLFRIKCSSFCILHHISSDLIAF